MPTVLLSFKIDPDSQVRVLHAFFAPSKTAAEALLKEHADSCPKFGPAWRANETVEFARNIDELPSGDGDDLEEWLMVHGDFSDEEEPDDDVIDIDPEEHGG